MLSGPFSRSDDRSDAPARSLLYGRRRRTVPWSALVLILGEHSLAYASSHERWPLSGRRHIRRTPSEGGSRSLVLARWHPG